MWIDSHLIHGVVHQGALFHEAPLKIPESERIGLSLHAQGDQVLVLEEGHRLDALWMDCASESHDLFVLLHIINEGKRGPRAVWRAFTGSDELSIPGDGQARELHAGISEHCLLPRLGLLNDELVVQREVGETVFDVPIQVVMHTAEPIVSIDELLLKQLVPRISEAQVAHHGIGLHLDVDLLVQIAVMVVGELSVCSLNRNTVWRWMESIGSVWMLGRSNSLELHTLRHDEGVFSHLVPEFLPGFVGRANLFEKAGLLGLDVPHGL